MKQGPESYGLFGLPFRVITTTINTSY